ncbi:putative phosphoprotein phosphatase [Oscillibacter valericigenes Sjm18-20]|nr:putative phosphoprotein phosphatase [Oscillibacter valericigenes Sjm18-20]
MKKKKKNQSFGKQLTVLIVLISAVLGFAAVTVSYRVYSRDITKYYDKNGISLVKTLASQLTADDLDRYYKTQDTDDRYYEIQNFILDLVDNNDVEYLYVVRPNGNGVTFLFDSDLRADADGDYYAGGNCSLGTYVKLEGAFAEITDQLLAGKEVRPIVAQDATYGWLMTAICPVLHKDGTMAGYVMADIDMNEVVNTQHHFLIGLSALLLTLTVCAVLLSLFILRRTVVVPINQLTHATESFVEANRAELSEGIARVNVPDIRTGNEVEKMAEAFRKMQEDMAAYVRSLIDMTAEKERIGTELSVATKIQADLLPRIFPAFPDRPEFDIYAETNPAKEVGGDFYDFFLIDEDHLALVIADVSGKGVPAALFMVVAKTLIKNYAQSHDSPADVFTNTNAQMCEGNDAGLFVTAWMAVLEISTGLLRYVNAGHNPPLLRRRGGTYEWLKSRPGFVLAGLEETRYRENTIQLGIGDRLFLYTDGVTEATDAEEKLFGEERLQRNLNDFPDDASVREVLGGIKRAVDAFVGAAVQFDDITMLGFEYRSGQGGAGND